MLRRREEKRQARKDKKREQMEEVRRPLPRRTRFERTRGGACGVETAPASGGHITPRSSPPPPIQQVARAITLLNGAAAHLAGMAQEMPVRDGCAALHSLR